MQKFKDSGTRSQFSTGAMRDAQDGKGGKVLVFQIKERPIVASVEYTGAKKLTSSQILDKLKGAPQREPPLRPILPPLNELALNKEERVEKLVETLTLVGCNVHRVRDSKEALEKLTEIVRAEGLTKILASEDDVVLPLDLPGWGKKNNVAVFTAKDCRDREDFKRIAFEEVEAGVTGVDFAVAESGTPITRSASTGCSRAKSRPRRRRTLSTFSPKTFESGRAK